MVPVLILGFLMARNPAVSCGRVLSSMLLVIPVGPCNSQMHTLDE